MCYNLNKYIFEEISLHAFLVFVINTKDDGIESQTNRKKLKSIFRFDAYTSLTFFTGLSREVWVPH